MLKFTFQLRKCMTIVEHLLILRKKLLNLSQSALGRKVGVVGRYEHGVMGLFIGVIRKTADTFKRVEEVFKLNKEEKNIIFMVIDALIRDFKAKKAYS